MTPQWDSVSDVAAKAAASTNEMAVNGNAGHG